MFDAVQQLHSMLSSSHMTGLISVKGESGILDMSNSASGGDVSVIVSISCFDTVVCKNNFS